MELTKVVFKNKKRLLNTVGCSILSIVAMLLMCSTSFAIDFDVKGTTVTVGGYAKLMMIYDTDGTVKTGPFEGDLAGAYDLPLDGHPLDDEEDFRMIARESRLFVKTKSPTDFGSLNTHVEADFYGDTGGNDTWSNSRTFRIRHAYGMLTKGQHQFLAGQTWSTFMDFAGGIRPMDFTADPGDCFVRQPMLKYQYNVRRGHYIAAALENNSRGLTAKGPVQLFTNPGSSSETVPDFIVKYFYACKRFTLSPKALLRRFELDGDDAIAYGLSLSSSLTYGKGHKLHATVMYGDGIGRYGGLGMNGGAGLTANGDIETVEFQSIRLGASFLLNKDVRWAIGCGWAENDDDAYLDVNDAVLTGSATKEAFAWSSNIRWKITPAVEYALGVSVMDHEVMDGRDGDMIRFQSYFSFSF